MANSMTTKELRRFGFKLEKHQDCYDEFYHEKLGIRFDCHPTRRELINHVFEVAKAQGKHEIIRSIILGVK